MSSRGRPRRSDLVFAAFLAVCALAFVWPGYSWAAEGRVAPMVFGLPFAFAWTVGWVLLVFLGLCVYHRFGGRGG